MLELADRLLPLLAAGQRVAVATSIDVIGSAPHLVGTSMAVTEAGEVIGSVSGGCVEAAALADCRRVLAAGGALVRRFGFGDAEAAAAGLACGGEIDVLVHGLAGAAAIGQLREALAGRPAALGLVVAGEGVGRIVGPEEVDAFGAAVRGRLAAARSGSAEIECDPASRLFVDVAAPARRMVIGGATETAVAVSAAAAALGFRVVVCDPRAEFTRADRFPAAERVVVGRVHDLLRLEPPAERDVVCVLGHDEDLDPLALAVALESAAGYVGALGSRSTAARRRARLAELGVREAAIERLHMPIGLDLGGSTPAETAIAILAEVLAIGAAASARPLRSGRGTIHRRPASSTAADGLSRRDHGADGPVRPAWAPRR